MSFTIERVDAHNLADFLAYAAAHGREHDDSFLPGPGFESGPSRPSVLARGRDGDVLGVLSLLLDHALVTPGRARVAILHASTAACAELYDALLDAMSGLLDFAAAGSGTGPVESVYLFLPAGEALLAPVLEGRGFSVERMVHLMYRPALPVAEPGLPEGWSLEALATGDAAGVAEFVAVRNRNFREVAGSSEHQAGDWLARLEADEAIEGGTLLLRSPSREARGTVHAEADEEADAVFIGTVSVDRGERGKGLGSSLLRAALVAGLRAGRPRAFLSVNAANEKALGLYRREGFGVAKAMACWSAPLSSLETSKA